METVPPGVRETDITVVTDTCVVSSAALVHIDTGHPPSLPRRHSRLCKEYGDPWTWDPVVQDYVRVGEDGVKHRYTDYQTARCPPATPAASSTEPYPYALTLRGHQVATSSGFGFGHDPRAMQAPWPQARPWEQSLGNEFQAVAKPKRFFTVGRIFKTVWFEPCPTARTPPLPLTPAAISSRPGPEAWANSCPPFHGAKPAARFRWFVVVRRRQHHSLCFAIITAPAAPRRPGEPAQRGRATDHAVLHNANVEPARPGPHERITRPPLAVIVEDEAQYVAPIARLDCGRVYTVEDHLPVAKLGRVHSHDLALLEGFYRETVL